MKFDTIDVRTTHDVDIVVSNIPNYEHIRKDVIKIIDNEIDPHGKTTRIEYLILKETVEYEKS